MPTLRYWDVAANNWIAMPSGPAGTGGGPPNPVASGAPFTTYTDNIGDLWVAKGGVYGGVYKRAIDALHARVWLNAAPSFVASTPLTVQWDTIDVDLYGMFNAANWGFIALVPGMYLIQFRVIALPSAACTVDQSISKNGVSYEANGYASLPASGWAKPSTSATVRAAVNDRWNCVWNCTVAGSIYAGGSSNNFATFDYLGTG